MAIVRHEPRFRLWPLYLPCQQWWTLTAGSLHADGLHLVRKIDAHGTVSIDLKRYDVSAQLVGRHVVLHLDAKGRCMQVLYEQQVIKSLPLKGIVGHLLSFEQFLTHMLHQARAQARLRSLQERKYRTAAFTAP